MFFSDKGKSNKKATGFKWQNLLFGFAIGFFIGTSVFFLYSDFFRIARVDVEGNKLVKTEDIRDTIRFSIRGFVYGVIPADHIVFFPKKDLRVKLADKNPRLDQIFFYRDSVDVLKISVTERRPIALWCVDEECSFVDNDGYVYAKAPKFSKGVFMEWSLSTTTASFKNRQPIEPEYFAKLISDVEELSKILKAASSNRWQIIRAEKGEAEDWNIFVIDKTDPQVSSWKIILNGHTATGKIKSALVAALKGMDAEAGAGSLPLIDYADIRFENKVFYRLVE